MDLTIYTEEQIKNFIEQNTNMKVTEKELGVPVFWEITIEPKIINAIKWASVPATANKMGRIYPAYWLKIYSSGIADLSINETPSIDITKKWYSYSETLNQNKDTSTKNKDVKSKTSNETNREKQ